MAIIYKIDSDLKDIIPNFMSGRQKDIGLLESAIKESDFAEIQSIGHKLKGNAGSYGFDGLGKIGAEIEKNAKESNLDAIKKLFEDYKEHLGQIEIQFV
ncbi:MAG: Hpt domain-containing protein [Bacteriovoracaceae bacterium]